MLMRTERPADLDARFDDATAVLTLRHDAEVVAEGNLAIPRLLLEFHGRSDCSACLSVGRGRRAPIRFRERPSPQVRPMNGG